MKQAKESRIEGPASNRATWIWLIVSIKKTPVKGFWYKTCISHLCEDA